LSTLLILSKRLSDARFANRRGGPAMTCRIAVVQHGDYREAQRVIGSGQQEPYFGMAYSLQVLDNLLKDKPHLLLSLEAPSYQSAHGAGQLVGLPNRRFPRGVPGSLAVLLRARRIRKHLAEFRPTHLLLRTNGLLACRMLRYGIKHGLNTL